MLTRGIPRGLGALGVGSAGVSALIGVMVLSPAIASATDDPDRISVLPGWAGWIDTEVADPGTLEGAREQPRPAHEPAQPRCTQSKSSSAGGYATEEQFHSGAPAGDGPGGWVVRRCTDGTMETAWVPAPEPTEVTPQRLAERATNRLPLPLPEPRFEPHRDSSAGPATLVAIPTWFFLDGWAPITQRTAAGATWAEVTAEPVATTWWPGDGSGPVRCAGAGRAWAATESPGAPCTYTYRRSSAAQPNNVYLARVVVSWRVTWSGSGGLTGTLPLMERQTTFPIAVAERQTVVVQGGDR